jgi:ATP/maltotriose-dependent transcriptional regulator MalT
MYGGAFEAFGRYAPAALAMAEEVGDVAAKCRALNINGLAAMWLSGEVEEGRAAMVHSATLGRQLGDNWALGDGVKLTTLSWLIQDDYVGLAPVMADLKEVAKTLGNRFFMAWYHTTVGWVAMRQGDFTLAEQEMALALAEDKELGGAATAGFVVAHLGEIEAQTGRYDAAESRLVPFLGRAAATGDFLGAPWGVPALARLLIGRGAAADARDMMAGFVDLLRPLGIPLNVSEGLNVLGAAHLALGDEAAAAEALAAAKALAASISNPWLGSQAIYLLGELARRRGALDEAEGLHQDALAMRASRGLRPGVVESLEALASLAVRHDSCTEAARLLGAASTLRDQMSLARWPVQMAGHERDVTDTRKALGEDAFTAAWAEGSALSIDDAVAYAARAQGERRRALQT